MSSAWEKWEKENAAFPVGQQADLHTKKKGSSKPKATSVTKDNAAMQEQLAAAMIRETEYLSVLRELKAVFVTNPGANPYEIQRALDKLKAVV